MFEKFYKRVEPKMETSGGRQASSSMATVSSQGDVGGSRISGRKRTKSRTSTGDRTLRLTAEQKCEIAQRELEEYTDEVRMANEDSEKHVDELKVSDKLLIIYYRMFSLHAQCYFNLFIAVLCGFNLGQLLHCGKLIIS